MQIKTGNKKYARRKYGFFQFVYVKSFEIFKVNLKRK